MNNEEQISHWNGDAGRNWAKRDDKMSTLLSPFSDALLQYADIAGKKAVLDIGCGGGSLSLALAEKLGHEATVVGIDISAPLLEVAEGRRENAGKAKTQITFLRADAAAHDFGETRFDLLISRFGVMFFDAPAMAFEQLRRAAMPEATLAFCCWQPLVLNPFVALPLKAALSVLPPPPPPAPRAPGPFAFAEPDYIEDLLQQSGWSSIGIQEKNIPMHWRLGGNFTDTVREMVNTGPVGGMLADIDDDRRAAIYEAAEELMAPYDRDGTLALDSAIWMVSAQNGSL